MKICTALKCDISDIMEIIEIERKRRDGTSFKERKTDTGKAYYEMGRWKTQMLGDIMPKIPQKYGKYIEPFIGGGALFLH